MTKQKINKKSRPIFLRMLFFILKIPLLLFIAWVDAKPKNSEPDVIEDLYDQNPNLFDPRPLRDRPPHERY